ncbi:hypothetical protein BMH32_10995 [Leucobacter sp. OLJS4]|uniref:cyclase family protein n=1 Tax=unclassified Leucobacter TaxID=2621730 RepID=UPI000C625EDD|nr:MULTISPECIES: cyclase family protein [unclassified Leucobacter]PIJ47898.1 hypothetical protein BMH30_06335 [Leucobacter sp. OLES1]PII81655.1 hypothetical protein BMH25_14185 [Leucobacter sp. OLCALW19]PII86327.1 hypothetical protein BMH26_14620 [Leucobacter sp. OLTLW20]PII90222.1 hypothetical protein BMH27_12785 [Leucobacter sp. OLAS13]PII97255.1 hypothetical protein BMH29_13470 [Leucobacter sp. OLDS2]
MQIIDLSPAVDGATAVWPGDAPFRLQRRWSIAAGDSVSVQTITSTGHVGAHIDAPAHVLEGAPDAASIDLDACIGSCLVLDVSELVDRSSDPFRFAPESAIRARIADVSAAPVERLLLRHRAVPGNDWMPKSPGVDPAFVRWFAEQGGRLLGIDLDSFDPLQDNVLAAHRAAIAAEIVLLEGLDLALAPEGPGELIAFPLRLVGADASPVHAVLRRP